MRTSSTFASGGPSWHRFSIVATTLACPENTASTEPSRRLRTHPLKPKERADLLRTLQESGKHTSERERHAMDAEREMVSLKKAQFMMTKMGEEFNGYVNTLATFGMFVELDNYFVEGLVRLSTLTDDDYDYYEKEYLIKGRRHGKKFRLGDSVRVRVAKINAFRSEIDFALIERGEVP